MRGALFKRPPRAQLLLKFYTNPSLFLAITVFTSFCFGHFLSTPHLWKSKTPACGRVRLVWQKNHPPRYLSTKTLWLCKKSRGWKVSGRGCRQWSVPGCCKAPGPSWTWGPISWWCSSRERRDQLWATRWTWETSHRPWKQNVSDKILKVIYCWKGCSVNVKLPNASCWERDAW